VIPEDAPTDLPGDGSVPEVDILDRRGRLVRLSIAVAIGAAVTTVVMLGILAAGVHKNPDAISQMMPFLLGAATFALTTTLALSGVTAVVRKRRR